MNEGGTVDCCFARGRRETNSNPKRSFYMPDEGRAKGNGFPAFHFRIGLLLVRDRRREDAKMRFIRIGYKML